MDSISIPANEALRKASRIACVLSLQKGSVPYSRSLGVDVDVDASAPAAAQRALALSVRSIERAVEGVHVVEGFYTLDASGRVKLNVKVEDA